MADLSVHYNDKVKLKDGGQGSVKYIGEVQGKEGVWYGIDLVKGTGKNNGTVKKEVYFKTRGGKKSGTFVRKSKIKSAKSTEYSVQFTVGDHVLVKSKGNGVVRFVGVPSFSKVPKPIYGVELDEAKGICDGKFKGHQYFSCINKHGIYIEQNKVSPGKSTQKKKKKKKHLHAASASTMSISSEISDISAISADEKPKKKKRKSESHDDRKDLEPETAVEPSPEPETKEEPDPESEPAAEVEPEDDAETQKDPEPEPEPQSEPENEADPEPEQEPETESKSDPEPDPESKPDDEAQNESITEPTEDADSQQDVAEENGDENEAEQEDDTEIADEVGDEEEPVIEPEGDEDVAPESDAAEEQDEDEEEEEDDDTKERESNESISEGQVIEYLKTNYKTDDSNVVSPHEIAKELMESQGIQEAQFAFHLNTLGKVTYWVVHSMEATFGDIEVPAEGFKLIKR